MAYTLPNLVSFPAPTPHKSPDDLSSWSEAAVCDRLFGLYCGVLADTARARQATRIHWSCWRAYLGALPAQGRAARQALTRILKEARLDPQLIERGDAAVVDELTDLVLHKYRRSPEQAKAYITRLVAAATQMTRAAPAAPVQRA
jgi:hypothetical protein